MIPIAHRLNTVRSADQIVVIDPGRISQKGIHSELMEQAGVYKRFWRHRSEATAAMEKVDKIYQ